MTPPPGVKEVSAGYGELALVEQPAIDLLTSLGWSFKNLYAETFGDLGSEGRESETQVILTRRLRAALEALNPGLPPDAYAQAVEQLAQDRSKQIAVNANRDFYRLLKDGVKVKVPDERGGHSTETLRVIDWATPANNEFFLASQMWVAGDMYRRRCDLLGFVNGLPLVFIELKKPAVPLKSAFDDNLRDYRGQSVPQLFHPNAFILLSNGSDTKVGTLTSAWEHFFEWKRVADEDEAGKVSLERVLRGLLEPARLLDYIENFLAFEEGKGGLIKLAAKNHQFLGVNKSIARLVELRETEKAERKRLGVFWHTQGSGKSLSMVFFTQKVLRQVLGSCTFVIVTDREELDTQISKTFAATGATTRERTYAPPVASILRNCCAATNGYIFTLIQKFRSEPGEPLPDAVGSVGRDRHHRRGAPQPVRHLRAEHAQRAAERRLHRLHRHAADQGRGGAHARGVRRLRQRVRLRPLDRRRRHGAAVLREPHPRGAAHQREAEPRPRGAAGSGRARRGAGEEAGARVRPRVPRHHSRRPSGGHRQGHGGALHRPRLPWQGDDGVHRQGHRGAHVRQGAGALEGRDRAAQGGARPGPGRRPRGADRPHPPDGDHRHGGGGEPGPERGGRPQGEGPGHRAAPAADAEGGAGREVQGSDERRCVSSSSARCGSPASTCRPARRCTSTSR